MIILSSQISTVASSQAKFWFCPFFSEKSLYVINVPIFWDIKSLETATASTVPPVTIPLGKIYLHFLTQLPFLLRVFEEHSNFGLNEMIKSKRSKNIFFFTMETEKIPIRTLKLSIIQSYL